MEGARQLDPQEGLEITASCAVHFLRHHLPLTAAQREWLEASSQPSTSQPEQPGEEHSGARSVHPSGSAAPGSAEPAGSRQQDGALRTRAHTVCPEDLEALRQVARDRVWKLESSSSVPAAAAEASVAAAAAQ